MEERRALLAIALSTAIIVIWFAVFAPKRPPVQPAPGAPVAETEPEPAEEPALETAEPVEAAPLAASAVEEIRLSNEFFDATLTNQGGRLLSWRLREYTANGGERLNLIPSYAENGTLPLGIELDDVGLADALNQTLYEVERIPLPADRGAGPGERVTFRWADGRGLEARKSFTIRRDSWLVDVALDVRDRGRRLPARLALGPGFAAQEPRRSTYYYSGGRLWNVGGVVTHARKTSGEDGFRGAVRWAGLEDQYFVAVVVPDGEAQVRWRTEELTELPVEDESGEASDPPLAKSQAVISAEVPGTGARLFIGPKDYRLLRGLGSELERTVWFSSWALFAFIAKYLLFALYWIHDHVTGNYGLAIIAATFLLRLLLFPLNQYSMVSMKKTQAQMQKLQPKIKSIRARMKKAKDPKAKARMNQEMMDLYKREGVNPMGGVSGCLPMLAQFPILIGFYFMLTVAVELRGAPFFGWIQDLSERDPYYITPLLMAVTMFAQQRMAMSKITDPMQQQQQKIMLFMPLVFGYFCTRMPSGLVLYWFVNNVLGIGQQWLVNRKAGRFQAAAQKA